MGVSHPTRGEAVKVFVVPEEGCSPSKASILGFLRERLAGYKIPKYVEFRTELPKTLVGKVLRRALRDEEAGKAAGVSAEGPRSPG